MSIHEGDASEKVDKYTEYWSIRTFLFENAVCMKFKCDNKQEIVTVGYGAWDPFPGLILGLRSSNERRCHFVTTSLIRWMQA